MSERKQIAEFTGTIYKVQSLAGGGFRVAIDGNSSELVQAAYLMQIADKTGVLAHITVELEPEIEARAGSLG